MAGMKPNPTRYIYHIILHYVSLVESGKYHNLYLQVQANKSDMDERERNWTENSVQDHIESKPPMSQTLCGKRKQPQDIEDLAIPHPQEPVGKRRRSLQPDFEEPKTVAGDSNCHPVKFWARHQVWPPKFAEKGSIMSKQNLRKRLSSYDYTQGIREGQNPKWWSLAHEREMVKYNMVMNLFHDQTSISDNSKHARNRPSVSTCCDFLLELR